MKVLIADDHGIIRLGVSQIIKEIDPGSTIHEAEDFDETIRLLNAHIIDLLILDINIPGGNNFQMISTVKSKQPDIKVLVFSAFSEELYATRYFKAGADGYLQKDTSPVEVKSAVNTILSGKHYMSQNIREYFLQGMIRKEVNMNNPLAELSDRETEVARMLVMGISQTAIAEKLNLHTSTVGTHKYRIFEKLAVSNIAELIEKYRIYDYS
ncbi:LuxR family two component transcriptional regulator [Anseongella ginsenosidimutans]|uniref:LuxR family two component transcriptional regulator n=1 Tax=Anseongella ginsenosidimutans TaxID=496056 RepID=A0A4R3KL58_9SPHI|nr:response regulator transcription factor [Anseongella ginsenosidimutans]QEC51490.1 response regulator transcription factor [Anseongella ginsenosidimutans]TCS84332.1 LuxR family two component transcriptional regulator [Anseongella ginsenosidimutans]